VAFGGVKYENTTALAVRTGNYEGKSMDGGAKARSYVPCHANHHRVGKIAQRHMSITILLSNFAHRLSAHANEVRRVRIS
jgi:hypothetical protein